MIQRQIFRSNIVNPQDVMAACKGAQAQENADLPPMVSKTAEEWEDFIEYRETQGKGHLDFVNLNDALLDSTDGQVGLYDHTHYHSEMGAGDYANFEQSRGDIGMTDSQILSFARGVHKLQAEGNLGLIQINRTGIDCEIKLNSFNGYVNYNAETGTLAREFNGIVGEVIATQYDCLEDAVAAADTQLQANYARDYLMHPNYSA